MEEGILTQMFGTSLHVRVLELFILNYLDSYSLSEASRELKVQPITLKKVWDILVKENIIILTKIVGKSKLYKLNLENPKVKIILKIIFEIAEQAIPQPQKIPKNN